ncbi:GGDEF domain-containing protein [Thiocapsa rosea]|uniref:diguanylate cyclase n=1 Tax=Thiocapsa rosea TaxID=69360 RepID=A0A495V696_9GAMM|nr:diguanylate cyclase [Thiocapsa rosea]RKT43857.1 diguanylate cyclase (GGDEF)-like protein [Thiocapsa rosea]
METAAPDLIGPREEDILSALTEQAYRQLPIALVVSLVNALLLTGVLWGGIEKATLLIWLACLVSVTAFRFRTLRAFSDPQRRIRVDDAVWRRVFVAGACAAGFVWGGAGLFLFHPSSLAHQVFLAFVLGGMVAGGVPLLSPLNRAYPCFAIPIVLPMTLSMVLVGDRVHWIMGMMILIFGIAMLSSSARVRRLFQDATDMRLKLASSIAEGSALQEMLRIDELTRIGNRRFFEEQLGNEWRRGDRAHATLAVISADIDHFKAYNDRYGHPAGDRCLFGVAQAMAAALQRPGDAAARIGGEEFAFVLPQTSLLGAEQVAERIREAVWDLNIPHAASPIAERVTVSLGVASSDHASVASEADLIRASDAALYEAKRRGRNQVATIAP